MATAAGILATTGILTVFMAEGAKFPNGSRVSEYMGGLNEEALEILEYLTPEHEKTTIERFISLHKQYLTGKKGISAQIFANKKFVVQFQRAFHIVEELGPEREHQMMDSKTAREILHFLFVYYFSYHEASESGKNIPLQSFSTWFYKLRTNARDQMRKDRQAREKALKRLTGRKLEEHNKRVALQLKGWKDKWQFHGYDGAVTNIKEMLHVVTCPEQDLRKQQWWEVLKVAKKDLDIHETVDEVDAIKTATLKKFRVWSRFLHPDQGKNQNNGIFVQDLLAKRFILLNDSKENMLKWHEDAADRAARKKRKRDGRKSYKERGRTILEDDERKRDGRTSNKKRRRIMEDSDSEPDVKKKKRREVIEIL